MTDDEILAYSQAHPLLPYTHIARHLGEPISRVYRVMHPKRKRFVRTDHPDPTPEYIAAAMQAIRDSHRKLMLRGSHELSETAGTPVDTGSDTPD